jgi:hypothetical protein
MLAAGQRALNGICRRVPGAGLGLALGLAQIGVGAAGYGDGMCCCAAMEIWTAA